MKKVCATILSVIYLATSAGATITMHYCMGKVYAANMVKDDTCSMCGMKKSKGCCTDEVKVIKAHDSHQADAQPVSIQPLFAWLQKDHNTADQTHQAAAIASVDHNNSPPGSSGVSLCIFHCVFRL